MNRKIKKVVGNYQEVFESTYGYYNDILFEDMFKLFTIIETQSTIEQDLKRTALLAGSVEELDEFLLKWNNSSSKIYLQGDIEGGVFGTRLYKHWQINEKNIAQPINVGWAYFNAKKQVCGICLTYNVEEKMWLLSLLQNANDPDLKKRQMQLFYSEEFRDFSHPNKTKTVNVSALFDSVEQHAGSSEVLELLKNMLNIDGTVQEEFVFALQPLLMPTYRGRTAKQKHGVFNKKSDLVEYIKQAIALGKLNSEESLQKYIQNEIQHSHLFQNKIKPTDIEILSNLINSKVFPATVHAKTNKARLPMIKAILHFVSQEFQLDSEIKCETIIERLTQDVTDITQLLAEKNENQKQNEPLLELVDDIKSKILQEDDFWVDIAWREVDFIANVIADAMCNKYSQGNNLLTIKERNSFIRYVLKVLIRDHFGLHDGLKINNEEAAIDFQSIIVNVMDEEFTHVTKTHTAWLEKLNSNDLKPHSIIAFLRDLQKNKEIYQPEWLSLVNELVNPSDELLKRFTLMYVMARDVYPEYLATIEPYWIKIVENSEKNNSKNNVVNDLELTDDLILSEDIVLNSISTTHSQEGLLTHIKLRLVAMINSSVNMTYAEANYIANVIADHINSIYRSQNSSLSAERKIQLVDSILLKVISKLFAPTNRIKIENEEHAKPMEVFIIKAVDETFTEIKNLHRALPDQLLNMEFDPVSIIAFLDDLKKNKEIYSLNWFDHVAQLRSPSVNLVKQIVLLTTITEAFYPSYLADIQPFCNKIIENAKIESTPLKEIVEEVKNNHYYQRIAKYEACLKEKDESSLKALTSFQITTHPQLKNTLSLEHANTLSGELAGILDKATPFLEPHSKKLLIINDVLNKFSEWYSDHKSHVGAVAEFMHNILPAILEKSIIEKSEKALVDYLLDQKDLNSLERLMIVKLSEQFKKSNLSQALSWHQLCEVGKSLGQQIYQQSAKFHNHAERLKIVDKCVGSTLNKYNSLSLSVKSSPKMFESLEVKLNSIESDITETVKEITDKKNEWINILLRMDLTFNNVQVINQEVNKLVPKKLLAETSSLYLLSWLPYTKTARPSDEFLFKLAFIHQASVDLKEPGANIEAIFISLVPDEGTRNGLLGKVKASKEFHRNIDPLIAQKNAISSFFDKISTCLTENNPYAAVLALAQFGEFLARTYPPDGLLNKVEMRSFLSSFAEKELNNLQLLKQVTECSSQRGAVVSEITKGVEGIKYLLGTKKVDNAFKDIKIDKDSTEYVKLAKFIKDDFVPNTPLRVQLENSIEQVHIAASETLVGENKIIANDYTNKVNEKCDEYFSDPDKNTKVAEKENKTKSEIFYNEMCSQTETAAKKLPSRFQDGLQKILLFLAKLFPCVKKPDRAAYKWSAKTHVGDIHETLLHHKKDLTKEPLVDDDKGLKDNDIPKKYERHEEKSI